MSAAELLGLPGVGKTHVLASISDITAMEVCRGHDVQKLLNLAAGIWCAGPGVLWLLFGLFRYRQSAGQEKLLLVLCERLGRVRRLGHSCVIDEGVLQALWGALWRSRRGAADTVAEQLVCALGPQLGRVYYVRCREYVHRVRVKSRAIRQPELRAIAFSGEDQYAAARCAMAEILRILRRRGVDLRYIDNTPEGFRHKG